MAKSIGKQVTKREKSKIKSSMTQLKSINYDQCFGRLAFSKSCEKNCLLSSWKSTELKLLIDCFKKVESETWNIIRHDIGLNLEVIKHIDLHRPSTLPPDATFRSIRVSNSMRLYGYRLQDTFYIIWFDREHIVCPQGKPKRYAV